MNEDVETTQGEEDYQAALSALAALAPDGPDLDQAVLKLDGAVLELRERARLAGPSSLPFWPQGVIIVTLNIHGVAVAHGPYLDEVEAHEVAEFLVCQAPTYWLDLCPEGDFPIHPEVDRYGLSADGRDVEQPEILVRRPTRPPALGTATSGPAR